MRFGPTRHLRRAVIGTTLCALAATAIGSTLLRGSGTPLATGTTTSIILAGAGDQRPGGHAKPGAPTGQTDPGSHGDATGSTAEKSSTPAPDGGHAKPVFITIDDRTDPTFNQLLGINDSGRISGYFGSGADAAHPNRGFVINHPYGPGNFVNENFPDSAQTQVVGINGHGTTVGFYVDQAGANIGFAYRRGVFTSVANPATPSTGAFNQLLGVNDNAVAVGFYNDAAGAAHAYTYDILHKTFAGVTLPVAADSVTATGINDQGDISGFYTANKVTQGFLLDHGKFEALTFGSKANTQALGVNGNDQVVGSYVDAAGNTHGFIWAHGAMTTVDDPNAVGSSVVNGLNERGQLVGFYVDSAGNTHGMLVSHGRD